MEPSPGAISRPLILHSPSQHTFLLIFARGPWFPDSLTVSLSEFICAPAHMPALTNETCLWFFARRPSLHCRKYSHRRHHSNTGSMEYDEVWYGVYEESPSPACVRTMQLIPNDRPSMTRTAPRTHQKCTSRFLCNSTSSSICSQVFVPKTLPEDKSSDLSQPLSPFPRLFRMTSSLLLGWPAYLFFNKSGRKYEEGGANHFIPSSPIFNDRERLWVREWGVEG